MKHLANPFGVALGLAATLLITTACNSSESVSDEGPNMTISSSGDSGSGTSAGSNGSQGSGSASSGSKGGDGSTSKGSKGSGKPGKKVSAGNPAPDPKQTCDAGKVDWALGLEATPQIVERAKRESGADTVRVLPPDLAVTQEFRYGRLNLSVDRDRIILSASCF